MGNRFKQGSGVFECRACGKQTRDVNGKNGALELCGLCQAKAEAGNSLSDNSSYPGHPWDAFENCQTAAECETLLEKLLAENPQ